VLTQLIGPNVELHHTKMLVKPPENGAPFPMHQDYPYFPHERHTMLAASIHLDDTDEENGCLHVVPGSHSLGPLQTTGESKNLDTPLEEGTALPCAAGDVLFFNYLTIHGSGVNRSTRTRRNVLFQYRDPADPPLLRDGGVRSTGSIPLGVRCRNIRERKSTWSATTKASHWYSTGCAAPRDSLPG
jgi:hypothetical protein